VDIPDMSLTFTTKGKVKIDFQIGLSIIGGVGATYASCRLMRDTTRLCGGLLGVGANLATYGHIVLMYVDEPKNGEHTYKAQWSCPSNVGNSVASSPNLFSRTISAVQY